jgi:exopolysaccharide biosynthesis polyprenyl glycosylphosphotransferase
VIKRNWKIFFVLLSQAHDLAAIAAAAGVVVFLKRNSGIVFVTPHHNLLIGALFFAVTYLIVASMLGLYRGSFHLSLRLQNFIWFRAYIICLLITLSINSLSQTFVGDKSVLTFTLSLGLFLLTARWMVNRMNLAFQRMGLGIHNILIAGNGIETDRLIKRFSIYPELGYSVKGVIVKEKRGKTKGVPQYTRDELVEVLRNEHIDRILVPTPDFSLNGHSYLQSLSQENQIKLKVISAEAEDILKISRIYDIGGITIVSPPRHHVEAVKKVTKLLFDIVGSILAMVILSPVFLLTIIAIAVESGWPIFFKQTRTSIKNGKEFNFIKFRSMVAGAEDLKDSLMEYNETDGALFKMKNDPRITRVGKLIRKSSIDELPQLFNVLKGDMSLVGPRPLPLADFEKAHETTSFWDAIKDRNSVKPGMTGLWQVSGRSEIKFKEMILLDLYYVENNSLLFDLEILFETISVVLFRRGAY